MSAKNMMLVLFCCLISLPFSSFAQTAGTIERSEQQLDKAKQLQERIDQEKPPVIIEDEKPAQPGPVDGQENVLVNKIEVTGVTLVPMSEIDKLTAGYQGKKLTISDMQKLADLITEVYRRKGYVTSRAYLPPQKIKDGLLEIRVIEGVTGNLDVKGNRFFRPSLIKRYVHLEKGKAFNYDTLRNDLSRLNEHPDRRVKAVLVPGKEPGTTDIVLEVKDKLPLHANLSWDNYGSRYLRKNHYTTVISDNNLLGFDDMFSLQYQLADGQDYRLLSLRYLIPVMEKLKIGFWGYKSNLSLGKEYKDLSIRGKSKLYSLYGIYELLRGENLTLAVNLGFDYKDNFNFQTGLEQSRDRLRVAKLGFDLDLLDKWGGRTIFSPEFDFGISGIMGGLHSRDPRSSRDGAGGRFNKTNVTLLRLQKMPFSSTLLWKNQLQFTHNILTATEQFQLGGISNVRGYPAAESVGDQGYAMTWEWSFPVYFIPKELRVPFTQERLYNVLRFAGFYDWGNVHLFRPQAGESKNKTLRSLGCGLRFNLPQNFALRADFAWPLDAKPSDGDSFHPWLQVSKDF